MANNEALLHAYKGEQSFADACYGVGRGAVEGVDMPNLRTRKLDGFERPKLGCN